MDNELPIVVLPSRWRWGLLAFMTALGFVAGVVLFVIGWTPWETRWEMLGYYLAVAIDGLIASFAWWNCIVAPPRVIIDEDGVGGRFIGGGFVGTKRIAWDDITGARHWKMHHPLGYAIGLRNSAVVNRTLYLDVNNDGGKYIPVRGLLHKWRAFGARLEKYLPVTKSSPFAFDITNSAIDDARASEIVAVINKLAKGKPPAPPGNVEESGKSPFAAD